MMSRFVYRSGFVVPRYLNSNSSCSISLRQSQLQQQLNPSVAPVSVIPSLLSLHSAVYSFTSPHRLYSNMSIETANKFSTIFEIIRGDHNTLRSLYRCYNDLLPATVTEAKTTAAVEVVTADIEKLQRIVNTLIKLVSQHCSTEQEVLYPRILSITTLSEVEKQQYYEEAYKEDVELQQMLEPIVDKKVTDSDFEEKFQSTFSSVLKHADWEESTLLPQMEKSFDSEFIQQMTKEWRDVVEMQPTRPHPMSPVKPPLSVAAHRASKLLDDAMDAAKGKEFITLEEAQTK